MRSRQLAGRKDRSCHARLPSTAGSCYLTDMKKHTSLSTFEDVFASVRDSHPLLFQAGSELNRWLLGCGFSPRQEPKVCTVSYTVGSSPLVACNLQFRPRFEGGACLQFGFRRRFLDSVSSFEGFTSFLKSDVYRLFPSTMNQRITLKDGNAGVRIFKTDVPRVGPLMNVLQPTILRFVGGSTRES